MIPEHLLPELSNLFHLARVALSGPGRDVSRYEQQCWAAREFAKAHPEFSSTAAYKQLDRDDAWRTAACMSRRKGARR